MKQIVIISRKWNNPKISMMVTDEELSFAIDLENFIKAVKIEASLNDNKLDEAVDRVVKGIKGESTRIMS